METLTQHFVTQNNVLCHKGLQSWFVAAHFFQALRHSCGVILSYPTPIFLWLWNPMCIQCKTPKPFMAHTLHPCFLPTLPYKFLSISYIQCMWAKPHNSDSSTRWTKRCVMMSKKGGNSCYSRTKHIATSFFNSPIVVGSTIFTQSFLKTWHKRIIDIRHPFDMRPQRHKSKMSCIMTWKSCDFIPFKSQSLWSFFFKEDT